MLPSRPLLRVLDANMNRAREGLRVCEEIARFVLENPRLTRRCQKLRYDLHGATRSISGLPLLQARDSRRDVGRPGPRGRIAAHRGLRDLLMSNGKRVQEALRVLEEFMRLQSPKRSEVLSRLRFRAYTLEQDLLSGLSVVRHR